MSTVTGLACCPAAPTRVCRIGAPPMPWPQACAPGIAAPFWQAAARVTVDKRIGRVARQNGNVVAFGRIQRYCAGKDLRHSIARRIGPAGAIAHIANHRSVCHAGLTAVWPPSHESRPRAALGHKGHVAGVEVCPQRWNDPRTAGWAAGWRRIASNTSDRYRRCGLPR